MRRRGVAANPYPDGTARRVLQTKVGGGGRVGRARRARPVARAHVRPWNASIPVPPYDGNGAPAESVCPPRFFRPKLSAQSTCRTFAAAAGVPGGGRCPRPRGLLSKNHKSSTEYGHDGNLCRKSMLHPGIGQFPLDPALGGRGRRRHWRRIARHQPAERAAAPVSNGRFAANGQDLQIGIKPVVNNHRDFASSRLRVNQTRQWNLTRSREAREGRMPGNGCGRSLVDCGGCRLSSSSVPRPSAEQKPQIQY